MVELEKPIVIDLLDTSGAPALSSTSDLPVVVVDKVGVETAAPDEGKTQVQSASTPGDEKPPANDEPEEKEPKAKGVQKRLDELTKQREDERRRAEAAEARLDRVLGAVVKEPAAAKVTTEEAEPVKPARADFADQEAYETAFMEYAESKAGWIARREVVKAQADMQRQQEAGRIEAKQQATREAYEARVTLAKTSLPDFDEVAMSPDVMVSMPMAAALLQSEHGPQVQYYLGKHPEEAAKIFALEPALQLMSLGRIEAQLSAPAAAKPTPSPLPEPVKPLSGAAPSVTKPLDQMSMDEYVAHRKAQNRATDGRVRH